MTSSSLKKQLKRIKVIRPIVRGKAKSTVEFDAKLDMSIDERGIARLEHLCFDAYNECDVLTGAIDRYRERTGHYPECVLVDQIYRNRVNHVYCKKHGIRISGPALGRPRALSVEEKKQAYVDNTDLIEVERGFCLAKRCYGLGLIKTKLDTTTRSSIALSILAMNVNYLVAVHFFRLFDLDFIKVQTTNKSVEINTKQCRLDFRSLLSRHYVKLHCPLSSINLMFSNASRA